MRALLLALVLCASPALADDTKAQAVALFEEGLKEMKAGNFEKACESLKKSNDLHADSGTRGSLARCYEKQGKVASSWLLWVDLAKTAPKQLRPDAAANAAKLELRLPRYIIKVAPKPEAVITIDGIAVKVTADATPIDPGTHVIEASGEGLASWRGDFTAVEGKTEEITIPLQQVDLAPHPQPPEPREQPPERPAPKSSRKTIGLVMIGAGGALAITGAVFGVIAKGRYDDAKDICGGDIDVCDRMRLGEAQDKVDSARSAGNIATITMIGGGAAIVTGIVLVLTAPKHKPQQVSITPAIGSDSAGLVLTRGF